MIWEVGFVDGRTVGSQEVNWRLNEPPAWYNECLSVGYDFKQDFSNVVGGEKRDNVTIT